MYHSSSQAVHLSFWKLQYWKISYFLPLKHCEIFSQYDIFQAYIGVDLKSYK